MSIVSCPHIPDPPLELTEICKYGWMILGHGFGYFRARPDSATSFEEFVDRHRLAVAAKIQLSVFLFFFVAGYFLLLLHFSVMPLLFFSSHVVPIPHGFGPCVLLVDLKVDWIRRSRTDTGMSNLLCYFVFQLRCSYWCGCDDEQVKLRM